MEQAYNKLEVGDRVKFCYNGVVIEAIVGEKNDKYCFGDRSLGKAMFLHQNAIAGTMGRIKPSYYDKYFSWMVRGASDQNDVDFLEKIGETEKTGGAKMEALKKYLDKNSDAFFTLAIVVVLDHFVLGGALREKIKNILESILDSKTKKLEISHD